MAECTGRFFVYASTEMEGFVLDGIEDANPAVHATFAKALTFSGRHSHLDHGMILESILGKIPASQDVQFKTSAYEGINVVFQNAPEKVSPGEVETMMRLTHNDSKVLASLVVELDLGAFK